MAELPFDEAVVRLGENEARFDLFVNDAVGYLTSEGVSVESIIAFLARLETEILGFQAAAILPLVEVLEGGNPGNRVVVKASADFGAIDSTKVYLVDGIVDMTGVSVEVPAGGIVLVGLSSGVSQLVCSDNSYTMFISAVGGCGSVSTMDLNFTVDGTSSRLFNLTGATGEEAITIGNTGFINCTSLGTLTGFTQGFESRTSRFGGSPTLTLAGTWLCGYFVDNSLIRGLDAGMTGPIYSAGAGFVMASRFRSNQNIDLPALASFVDFASSNFTSASTLQFTDMIMTRDGIFDSSDANYTPNIQASHIAADWTNNTGMNNTYIGGSNFVTTEAATTIGATDTFVDLAGTYTAADLQHFDSPENGQLRHLGDSPSNYRISGQVVLESNANNVVNLKIVIWRDAAGAFEDGRVISRQVNSLQGSRNVAYLVLISNIVLNKNDFVKLQVANATASNDITAELDSFYTIGER